jgi:prefoldin subunit 1
MSRFMMRERDTLDSDNVKMEKTIADDLEQLGKKAKYLEKQFNEANSQLRDIVSVSIILLHRYHADE